MILVSHQTQFADDLADSAIVLSHGRVLAQGTPEAIAKQGLLPSSRHAVARPVLAKEESKGYDKQETREAEEDTAKTSTQEKAPEPQTLVVAAAPAASAATVNVDSKSPLIFYLHKVGIVGCVHFFGAILALATCRALADWALGQWIVDNQEQRGSAALYTGLTAATVAFGFSYALAFTRVVGAASRIHHQMLHRVLRAPKSFYDTTPLGMLLNLFSKDMDTLDELLPVSLSGLTKCVTIVGTALIVSTVAAPAVLVVIPVVWLIFRRLSKYFLLTSQQLKRIDKNSSGPLFSLYAESLQGVTSIRAFALHAEFERALIERLDRNHTAHFLWVASSRWFALRLDWLTSTVVLCVGVCVLLFRSMLQPALAALALTYILQIASLFQWGFRNFAECQNHFVSVERALAYTRLPQEAAAVTEGDTLLRGRAWPQSGALSFQNVSMRYRPALPLVLRGASFEVAGGAKAAIVGRSGAGKSSLSVALLRLTELDSGSITIDGVDISSVGLSLLRRSITFIQQDAVLFSGSIASNLDPFNEHSEAELEHALASVDFARLSGCSGSGVRMEVSESGANLSAGMRQLVMLARAMLRSSRLLVMDEATAHCDFATDAVIQRVVRTQFAGSTLLTIAHRITTIIDYELLLMIADGAVAEAGRPIDLLQTPGSHFGALVARGGEQEAERLRAAAAKSAVRP